METSGVEFNTAREDLTYPDTENRGAKHRACDDCKRRKTRCSGKVPCQHCQRNGNPCQYSSPYGRLANAEKRLVRYQKRICSLEAAWRKYLPNVNIADVIREVDSSSPVGHHEHIGHAEQSSQRQGMPSIRGFQLPDPPWAAEESSMPAEEHDEVESEQADSLDWDESAGFASAGDGIGSLSMSRRGVGYMGPQSGNALLKNLQSIYTLMFPSPESETAVQNPIKPNIAEDVLQSARFSDCCIEWYFKYYNCAYPVLHEGYFRAQCMGALPKPKDGSWPILYNMVLSIGAFCSHMSNQNADSYFYRNASRHLSFDLLQRGSLPLVQALTLMSNYLQKRNRPNSGFTVLGAAMNMAQSIGLHREFAGATISPFAMEIRRRVWWTIYIFDSGARLTFGRPPLAHGGVTARLPRNLNDKDLAVDMDELPESRDSPTSVSSLIWQSKLAHISNSANVKLLESRVPLAPTMLLHGDKVVEWSKTLPPYMQSSSDHPEDENMDVPRMVLLWRSMHLRIVIYRPFLLDLVKRRQPLDLINPEEAPRRCVDAAQECVTSIVLFWSGTKERHGALVWYACYWLVTATFVHVTCLLYNPQHEWSLNWRQEIENAKVTLEEMGVFEPMAARAARIISRIMGLVPTSPDSTLFASNEPIRIGFAELWNQSWVDMALLQGSPFNYPNQD